MATDLQVRTFDPKQVVVTFGPVIVSGYAEGTFVTIEESADGFEKRRGSDGSMDRINKNVFDAQVTLTLMQTSPTNNALSVLYDADKLTNVGVLPLVVKDLNGTTLFTGVQSWIKKRANIEFGDSLGNREWVFDTGASIGLVGSN